MPRPWFILRAGVNTMLGVFDIMDDYKDMGDKLDSSNIFGNIDTDN